MAEKQIYKVIFHQKDEVYEVFAREIFQSDLFGFLEVEELLFGERSQVVVDPGEEKLKSEFSGVKRSYIPMHSIVRIDEVEKLGPAKVVEGQQSKVTPFPNKPDSFTV